MGMRVLAGTLCLIWRQDWAAVKALWGPDLRSRMPFSDRLMPMILVEATRGIVVPSRVKAGGFVSRGMMMFMDLVALNSIWWSRAQLATWLRWAWWCSWLLESRERSSA